MHGRVVDQTKITRSAQHNPVIRLKNILPVSPGWCSGVSLVRAET
jgi:hypothetical protein